MCSTLDIRNDVVQYKDEYSKSNNSLTLLYAAIYKGLYMALGGKKGIALSSKMNSIVFYSNIIFKYKIKLNSCVNKDKAINYLLKNLREQYKTSVLDDFLDIPVSNEDIAKLLADVILMEYTEDIVINFRNIYNIALSALEKI